VVKSYLKIQNAISGYRPLVDTEFQTPHDLRRQLRSVAVRCGEETEVHRHAFHSDTQTNRQAGRNAGRKAGRNTDRQTELTELTGRQTDRQTDRQPGRHIGRQADRQADKHTDRQAG